MFVHTQHLPSAISLSVQGWKALWLYSLVMGLLAMWSLCHTVRQEGDAADSMDNALSHTLTAHHLQSQTHTHAFTISNLKTGDDVYLPHVP